MSDSYKNHGYDQHDKYKINPSKFTLRLNRGFFLSGFSNMVANKGYGYWENTKFQLNTSNSMPGTLLKGIDM